jgi:hypothetical protein
MRPHCRDLEDLAKRNSKPWSQCATVLRSYAAVEATSAEEGSSENSIRGDSLAVSIFNSRLTRDGAFCSFKPSPDIFPISIRKLQNSTKVRLRLTFHFFFSETDATNAVNLARQRRM